MPASAHATGRFGTFGGVFTPCTLTILGVIMFLRFGQVVGQAGILHAVLIVLGAKAITTLTSLSLSAIATNTRVRGGGAYYLISRSLGVEFGGAIGVVFYLAQAVSVAMYVIGFTEALRATWPGVGDATTVATVVNIATFVCVYIGAGWTIKVQYGILGALLLAIGAFVVGALQSFDGGLLRANWQSDYGPGESFLTMFALFFPAATGIMAGANMSGDLKDPARAIPKGTLLAVLTTGVIYLAMAVLLGCARDREALLGNSMVVADIAPSAALITLGIFCATLSSALGSMMGAPRIMQALARDQIFPVLRPLGAGAGPSNEPRAATVLTFLIAEAGILLGDLDAIAPVITMFFLITYGALNLATFYEAITRNPSWRPTFRWSHWGTALLGTLGCLGAMLLISPLWAIVSVLLMAGLHHYVSRKEIRATWGDVQSGAAFERARTNLLRLENERFHAKNWRPVILAFGGAAWNRAHLAIYGHWLTGGRGLLTLAQVITGDLEEHSDRVRSQEKVLRTFSAEHELDAFPAVVAAPSLNAGVEALVQCSGIGALRPNLVLFGWLSDKARLIEFCAGLRIAAALKRSLVVAKVDREIEDLWQTPPGTIDVWWRGRDNGHLMLILAHLMDQSAEWRGRTVRLLRMIANEAGVAESRRGLEALLQKARIHARPHVVVGTDFRTTLAHESQGAAVVMIGFEPPAEGGEQAFLERTTALTTGLQNVLLVYSTGQANLDV